MENTTQPKRNFVYHSKFLLQHFVATLILSEMNGNEVFTQNEKLGTTRRNVLLDIDEEFNEPKLILGKAKHQRVSIVGEYNAETNELSFGFSRFRNYSPEELAEAKENLTKFSREILKTDAIARNQRIIEMKKIQKFRTFSRATGIEIATANLKTQPILVIKPETEESIGKQFAETAEKLFLDTITDENEKQRILRILNFVEENKTGKQDLLNYVELHSLKPVHHNYSLDEFEQD